MENGNIANNNIANYNDINNYIYKKPNDINVGDELAVFVDGKMKLKTLAHKVEDATYSKFSFTYSDTIITKDHYAGETYIPATDKSIPANKKPGVDVTNMTINTKYTVDGQDATLVNIDKSSDPREPIFKLTFWVNPIIQTVSNTDTLLVYSPPAVSSGGKQKSRRNQTKSRKSKKSRKNRKSNRRSFRATKN